MDIGLGVGNPIGLLLNLALTGAGYQEESQQARQIMDDNQRYWQQGADRLSALPGQVLPQLQNIAGQTGQEIRDLLGGVTAGYGDALSSFDRSTHGALQELSAMGDSERQRISRESRAYESAGASSLQRRGLGSSYLINANRAMARALENRARLDLEDRLSGNRAQTMLQAATSRAGLASTQAGTAGQLGIQGQQAIAQLSAIPIDAQMQLAGAQNQWIAQRPSQEIIPSVFSAWRDQIGGMQAINVQRQAAEQAASAQDTANIFSGINTGLNALSLFA